MGGGLVSVIVFNNGKRVYVNGTKGQMVKTFGKPLKCIMNTYVYNNFKLHFDREVICKNVIEFEDFLEELVS